MASTRSSSYAWEEISTGHWRRRLFGMEPYFVFLGNMTASVAEGRQHYTVCSTVKLAKPIDIEVLKKTWIHLRFKQPQLATWANSSDWTMHYEVPEDVESWVQKTLLTIPNTSYAEFYSNFPPIKTVTLYWLPQSNELIFRNPHWQADGIGSWLFWDALFTSLEVPSQSLSWGEEVTRLYPVMQDIWGIKIDQAHHEQGVALFNNWVVTEPGLGPDPVRTTPGNCQKIELEFDKQTTSSILDAIKRRGVTVTAAFHAAFASANAKVAGPKVKSDYSTMSNINFRKYLGPYTSSDYAINVYYAPIPMVTPIETFDKTLSFMSEYYKETYDDPGKQQTVCAFLEYLFQAAQSPEFQSAPVPGDAELSSLGVVERYIKPAYGDVEIIDFHTSVDIVLGMALTFLYTFDGRLRFTYCYNDGLQDRSVIEGIVASTKAILTAEFS